MSPLLGLWYGITSSFQKVDLNIWKLKERVTKWVGCLENKDTNPKFIFFFKLQRNTEGIPHAFIKGIIEYKKDPNQVIVLINDPKRWPSVNVAKILYDMKKLSNTLNFKDNVSVGFSVEIFGELIVDSLTTNFDSTRGEIEYVAKGKVIIEP